MCHTRESTLVRPHNTVAHTLPLHTSVTGPDFPKFYGKNKVKVENTGSLGTSK